MPPSWKAICDWVCVWKHLPWILLLYHLVLDLFLSLVSIIIQFLFSFICLSCDFHQNNGKKQGIDIFSTGHPPWYIIIAILLSWIGLVIGFNNNSINTVSFSIFMLFMWFSSKNGKKQGIAIFSTGSPSGKSGEELHRSSSCCKSWRGSCGHRS